MTKPGTSEKYLKLSNPQLSFAEKLKMAITYELDYWEDRQFPPNLPVHFFRQTLLDFRGEIVPRWVPRKSASGEHCDNGEDHVFNFEIKLCPNNKSVVFYCKGYFFDKGNLQGVTIQSFRVQVATAKVMNIKR